MVILFLNITFLYEIPLKFLSFIYYFLLLGGYSGSSVGKELTCSAEDPSLMSVRKINWRSDRLPSPVFVGIPCGSAGKEFAWNVRDLGLIPRLERSPGEGKGYLIQYSGLENSMDCIVNGVTKSQTQSSNFHFTSLHFSYYSNCISKQKIIQF